MARLIEESSGVRSELVIIKTTGDMILSVPLSEVGGKGLFVKEIEEALLAGTIDVAVHSMKDVPALLPEKLVLGVILKREDPRDALVSSRFSSIDALPSGALIGTSSLRRIAQLRFARPDLTFLPLRGNVGTRLRKLDDGQVDAIILAAAGLVRLGHADRIRQLIPPDCSLPAVGQGALGLEFRLEDTDIRDLLAPLGDFATTCSVMAERGVLFSLNGGCQLPLAAYASLGENGTLSLTARVLDPEGTVLLEERVDGSPDHSTDLGIDAGNRLLSRGGRALLDAVPKH